MLTGILYHNWPYFFNWNNLTRFSKMKITTSNQGTLNTMGTLGEQHDNAVKEAKGRIEKECHEMKNSATSENCQSQKDGAHPGYAIVFDNIDFEMKRKEMTMVNQNKDVHWVNHQIVFNRVSGNQLEWEQPNEEITKVPNIKFLPSVKDYQHQRHNYIVLVSRILVSYFDIFSPLKEVCIQHIKHKYVKEMAAKSTKVQK